eukprot:TRINITY_DN3749_c0_g1_i3.p2 TRINITY_DN3749_c0_g1~~TRINITY_DN3749_c0_g1_i3.p2  ORF type:complete len:163 (-),score=25.10 TRINITY_DN3749_c0_g1_i3:805-1293(-)
MQTSLDVLKARHSHFVLRTVESIQDNKEAHSDFDATVTAMAGKERARATRLNAIADTAGLDKSEVLERVRAPVYPHGVWSAHAYALYFNAAIAAERTTAEAHRTESEVLRLALVGTIVDPDLPPPQQARISPMRADHPVSQTQGERGVSASVGVRVSVAARA